MVASNSENEDNFGYNIIKPKQAEDQQIHLDGKFKKPSELTPDDINQMKSFIDTYEENFETPPSQIIRRRIENDGGSFNANENISEYIEDDNELQALQDEIEGKLESLFQSLIIDTKNDHNTQETAKRVAKMYIHEMFKGRYYDKPHVTDFPNAKQLDEVYTLGPITIRSTCSHHLVPILGQVWVGVKPSDKVIGISKFNRIVDWVMSRPHIQEEAAIMVADVIENLIKPQGLAVVIKAQHLCMSCRGVKETNTSMVNSIMRGGFRNDPHLKKEFLDIIKSQGFDGTLSTIYG